MKTRSTEGQQQARNIDIMAYSAMLDSFLNVYADQAGHTDPDITEPILSAYGCGPYPGMMRTIICAFVGGVNAGIDLALSMQQPGSQNNSN